MLEHDFTAKQILVAKIRDRYRDANGEDIPADFSDDEVIAQAVLFLLTEMFL